MKISVPVLMLAASATAVAGDLPLLAGPVLQPSDAISDIALADLDGDGIDELLTAEGTVLQPTTLSLRPGLGAGRFGPEQELVSTNWQIGPGLGQQIATADLDADGDLDVLFSEHYATRLFVLRNDGGLRFETTEHAVGNNLRSVATGDVDGDGKLDVAVASFSTNTVAVLLGDGSGGLRLASSPGTGFGPISLALADLNHDGLDDIATADFNGATVGVRLATGGGSFGALVLRPLPASATAIAAADLTGDGAPELIVGCQFGGLFVLANSGGGAFGAPVSVPAAAGLDMTDVLPVDLDGNGRMDVVLGAKTGTARVLFGTGSGALQITANSHYTVPTAWRLVALGHFGGDALPDVLAFGDQRAAYTGIGAALDTPVRIPLAGRGVGLGDVTGDGRLDVLGLDDFTKSLTVRIGNGTDTLDTSPSALVSTQVGAGLQQLPGILRAADLDGDGDDDPVTVVANAAQPTLGQPDGTLVLAPFVPLGVGPGTLHLTDLDGDGAVDMLSSNNSSSVRVYLGGGNGSFALHTTFASGNSSHRFATGDVDADGDLDLATSGFLGLRLHLGAGDGSFGAPTQLLIAESPKDAALTDLDADGDADLLTSSFTGLRVSLADGTGGFLPPVGQPMGDGSLVLADIDADGRLDAVTSFDRLAVFLANGDGTLAAGQVFVGGLGFDSPGRSLAAGDLNGDGDADVLSVTTLGSAHTLEVLPSRTEDTTTTLGGALAGAGGAPQLQGTGTLAPLAPLALHVTQAAPLALATLIVGLDDLNLPFKGGVLVPSPDVIVAGLLTNASGALLLSITWPSGVASGSSFWMQVWVVDAGGPKGLAATNALRLDVP